MKLASYKNLADGTSTIGVVVADALVDLHAASNGQLPAKMIDFLELGAAAMERANQIQKDAAQTLASSSVAEAKAPDGRRLAHGLDEVELMSPVPRPGKIMHTSCNFGDHLKELIQWPAKEWQQHNWSDFHFEHPTGFLEAPSSVVGSGATVIRPVFTKQLDFEIELGIIIGKRAHRVPVEEALDYVAGYTVFNDISARDIQAREHANKVILLGKSFDTSCPLGPYLVTTDEIPDPEVLEMTLRVNGKVRQHARTGEMITKPAQMVAWWSHMTLEPGDVLTSGSPPGVIAGMKEPVWLDKGDVIEAEIESIGVLRNFIDVEE